MKEREREREKQNRSNRIPIVRERDDIDHSPSMQCLLSGSSRGIQRCSRSKREKKKKEKIRNCIETMSWKRKGLRVATRDWAKRRKKRKRFIRKRKREREVRVERGSKESTETAWESGKSVGEREEKGRRKSDRATLERERKRGGWEKGRALDRDRGQRVRLPSSVTPRPLRWALHHTGVRSPCFFSRKRERERDCSLSSSPSSSLLSSTFFAIE